MRVLRSRIRHAACIYCHDVVKSARQSSGPPTTYELAKVVAHVRDGFQCIFTGRYDRIVAWALPDVKERVEKHDLRTSSTKASFILPERHHDPNSDDEDDYQPASSAKVSLSRLILSIHGIRIDEELKYRAENILTMAIDYCERKRLTSTKSGIHRSRVSDTSAKSSLSQAQTHNFHFPPRVISASMQLALMLSIFLAYSIISRRR